MSTAAFYSTPARCAALTAAADRWSATPFRHNSMVAGPGGGVDCVRLCYALHLAAGAFEAFEVPSLPLGWHEHHAESGILAFFQQPHVRSRLLHLDREDPVRHGDLVAVLSGHCVHHLGTALQTEGGLRLFHVPRGGVAQCWPLDFPSLRVASLWRITEPVLSA